MNKKHITVLTGIFFLATGGILFGAEATANFSEHFEKTVSVGKTSWKIKDGQKPASWRLKEGGRGEKALAVLKHPEGKGNFIRLKGGTIRHDISPKGSNFTISYRYRGKGSLYFYVISYNKKGENLPSKLALHLNNVEEKEWKDGKLDFEQSLEEGGRRIFQIVVFPNSEFDFDTINLSIK